MYIYIYMSIYIYMYTQYVYIYIFYNLEQRMTTSFSHWPNTAEFGEVTFSSGHMPMIGNIWDKWHVWRIWTSIGKIYSTHFGQILEHIYVMITPACLQLRIQMFGIYALWPKERSYAKWQNIQSFGGPGIYRYNILYAYNI